ncbi:MAG: TOBE domain-containing protein, partial [Betaproteobacteria bacterium]|nr:TOBE domain-containing protein [Betaproteobacteria bacterium]
IICMREGTIEQVGSARELYRFPANRFVADFIGVATFLDGTIVRKDGGDKALVRLAGGIELWSASAAPHPEQRDVTVSLRPENVALSQSRPEGPNVLTGTILYESFLGGHTEYVVDVGGFHLKSRSLDDLAVGSRVFASIDPQKVICLPRQVVTGAAGPVEASKAARRGCRGRAREQHQPQEPRFGSGAEEE